MVERFDGWIHELGAAGYLLLGLAALLEYLCPPLPGDTLVVLGGVYAVRGERSWALVFAATLIGSVGGAALNYAFGRFLATRLERRGQLPFGLSHQRLEGLQKRMRTQGGPLILFNRFMPAVRALVFVAAGAARMPMGKVLALGALSASAWNLIVLALGIAVGGNAERLERLVLGYQEVVLLLFAAVGVLLLLRHLWFRRRSTRGGER
ncbi:MAG: DedA family protein [Myxococcota bacterium]